jgi:hypothetical protein
MRIDTTEWSAGRITLYAPGGRVIAEVEDIRSEHGLVSVYRALHAAHLQGKIEQLDAALDKSGKSRKVPGADSSSLSPSESAPVFQPREDLEFL